MIKNKLAIVIPYYKPEYFVELLESLRNQSEKNFSLYIGNDCSPNDPNIILNDYKEIITNYKYYENNIGSTNLNLHWNRCIDDLVQDEEWIMVLCDDDLLELDVIESFYKNLDNLDNNQINVVRFATKVINQTGNLVLKEFINYNNLESSLSLFEKKILEKTRSSLSEYIFKKSAYQKNKFKSFNLSFGSDNVAWLEFSNFNLIYCINDSYVKYRFSELSVSGNENLKVGKMLGELEYLNYLIKNYKSKFSTSILFNIYERYYHYYRSLNRNIDINFIRLIIEMFNDLGLKSTLEIIKSNKNYFNKIYPS